MGGFRRRPADPVPPPPADRIGVYGQNLPRRLACAGAGDAALSAPLAGVSSSRYWGGVITYIVVLLSMQSVMGFGIDKFKELWGDNALEVVAYLIVGVGAFAVVGTGARMWTRCSPAERGWIALALVLYGIGTVSARYPQEQLHYLGYGLLAMLLYVGFARDRAAGSDAGRGNAVFAPAMATLVVGSLVGLADELLQILWPRRYFDWADARMNVLAVGLGLLVAIPVFRAIRRQPPPRR